MDGAHEGDGADDPGEALLRAVENVFESWIIRCVEQVSERQLGAVPSTLRHELERTMPMARAEVMAAMRKLLDTDVDEQRSNPLSVLRGAVRHPTALLAAAAVPPLTRDTFAAEAFPEDVYDLSPATWSDVDPSLHEPGIAWGAWKASVVLARRRAEGQR